MSNKPDWMTNMDVRILRLLEKTRRVKVDGMWLTPKTVALSIDASSNYVNTRLRELAERGLIERDDGYYRITTRGGDYIQSSRP